MPADNSKRAWPLSTLTRGEALASVGALAGVTDLEDIKDFIVMVHVNKGGQCEIIKVGTAPESEWRCDIE